MNDANVRVGIFAASSPVPEIELAAGLEHLRAGGFEPVVHAQVPKRHFTFAGSDDERAAAICDFAYDDSIDVLWAARGGYGAGRLLPILDRLTAHRGAPPPKGKLIVGYSDVTVLHEYARSRWGWSTLHAPMPSASGFPRLDVMEWRAIVAYVRGRPADPPWAHATLRWLTAPPAGDIEAELIGGNLALWSSLAGTPYAQPARGKILFLEDTDEPFYRIDRMMTQLAQSGALDGAAAIVLGDFTQCRDESAQCLADAATGTKRPLRKTYEQPEAWQHIFADLGHHLGVPVAQGLPVGHGPHYAPLPLGARYALTTNGQLSLVEWDWVMFSHSWGTDRHR
ncbi:MAG TPA: LD-carboxypeptidase [Tepidisphaeraceae bacterium]|nr:LD-carboxypeptidase [Tepidisphaeraceae bacterium]